MQNRSALSGRDRKLLILEGWTVISEKPMELQDQLGSIATKMAALEILVNINKKHSVKNKNAVKFAIRAVKEKVGIYPAEKINKVIEILEDLLS